MVQKSNSVKNKRSGSSNSQRGDKSNAVKNLVQGNSGVNVNKQGTSWTNFSKNWSKKITQSSALLNKKQDVVNSNNSNGASNKHINNGGSSGEKNSNGVKQQLIFAGGSQGHGQTGSGGIPGMSSAGLSKSSNGKNARDSANNRNYKQQLSKLLQSGNTPSNTFFKSLEDRKLSKNS